LLFPAESLPIAILSWRVPICRSLDAITAQFAARRMAAIENGEPDAVEASQPIEGCQPDIPVEGLNDGLNDVLRQAVFGRSRTAPDIGQRPRVRRAAQRRRGRRPGPIRTGRMDTVVAADWRLVRSRQQLQPVECWASRAYDMM
jgi:hypothetical protein